MQNFLDRFFEIMKRAYYLLATIFSIGCVFGTLFWLLSISENRGGSNSDVIGFLILGLVTLPIAWLLHRTAHWVVWGKFK